MVNTIYTEQVKASEKFAQKNSLSGILDFRKDFDQPTSMDNWDDTYIYIYKLYNQ